MENIKTTSFNNQKIEESEVIKRILGGEKELYEILIRRNNQKLYRAIRSYLKDEDEIEDIMQNSYILAYTNLHQFKLQSFFSTWLIRIGINQALARLKEKGKLYHLNEQPENFRKTEQIVEMPDHTQLNPQDKMIQTETKLLLQNAIDHLELKYRTVYILKEVEGMSLKELASALNLTVSNVKVRLHRAKAMLKENLYDLSVDKDVFEFGFSRCDRITKQVMERI